MDVEALHRDRTRKAAYIGGVVEEVGFSSFSVDQCFRNHRYLVGKRNSKLAGLKSE